MNLTPDFLEAILLASILGLIKWVWGLQKSLDSTKLDLAKNYHGKAELRQVVDDAVRPLIREMEKLTAAIIRLENHQDP